MVRTIRNLLMFSAVTAVLCGLLFLEQEKLLLESELILQSFGRNLSIVALSLYLTAFMAILLFRYIALICCSFLEHLRSTFRPVSLVDARGSAALPFVSIVVPAYNEGLVIEAALNALIKLDFPSYEVIVIDDGSTDDTYERAARVARSSINVPVTILSRSNSGKAAALNVGLAHAKGEFIFNMDADTRLSPGSLRACVGHFDDPKVGAVAGNVKVANRENTLTRLQALEYIEGLALVRKAQSYFHAVSIIPGPAGMFRRSALMQVRGYDSDTYAEDCDVTMKLLLCGWQVSYESTAIASVETPSRLLDLIKQRYRWTRGMLQAARKHRAALVRHGGDWTNAFVLFQILFESVIWPLSNVMANIFFIYIGIEHGLAVYLLFWWLQLTLLDIVAATYCVVLEKEDRSLLVYAPLFRICYLLIMDVTKVCAALEELFRLKMSWGKLAREGKL